MAIFTLKRLELVQGKQEFYDLLIDGESQYEQFTKQVIGIPQYYSELKTLLS